VAVETLESRPSPPDAAPAHAWGWRERVRGARYPALALAGGIVACGYIAAVDPNGAGGYPACPLKAMTGIDCPGCGVTRSVHALLSGDVTRALDHNVLFVIALPFLFYGLVRWAAGSMGLGLPALRAPDTRWFAPVLAVTFLAFFVARNLPVSPLDWLGSAAA
jgi:hypothetical protein